MTDHTSQKIIESINTDTDLVWLLKEYKVTPNVCIAS